jgi:hypothetical protein
MQISKSPPAEPVAFKWLHGLPAIERYRHAAAPVWAGERNVRYVSCAQCCCTGCEGCAEAHAAHAERHHRGTLRVHSAGVLAVLADVHSAVPDQDSPAQGLRRPLDRNARRRPAEGVHRCGQGRHPGAQPQPDVRPAHLRRVVAIRRPRHARDGFMAPVQAEPGEPVHAAADRGVQRVPRGRRPAGDQHGGRHPGGRSAAVGVVC